MILDSQISEILSVLNSELRFKETEKIDHDWIDGLRETITDRAKEASQDIERRHPRDTQLAWLSTLVIGHLAFIVDILMHDENVSDELQTKIDIFGNLLVGITNRCIGLNLLIENGLEAPARVMMRSIYEFCWLATVIAFDDSKLKFYLNSRKDDALERKIWNTHFNPRELVEHVEKAWAFIASKNNHPIDYELNKTLEKYRWYTKSSHPSYVHASILTYATYDVGGTYKPNLFGAASIGILGIQQDFYWLAVETIYLLMHILFYKHGVQLSKSNYFHKQIICLVITHVCASMNPKIAPEAAIKLVNAYSESGIIVD